MTTFCCETAVSMTALSRKEEFSWAWKILEVGIVCAAASVVGTVDFATKVGSGAVVVWRYLPTVGLVYWAPPP